MLPMMAALGFATHLMTVLPDSGELRGESLMNALRHGGYTILLRHARTDRSLVTGIDTGVVERSGQRNLSSDGVRDAKLIGSVIRKYGIPVGEIQSSPMYRTRETAEFAFGTPTLTLDLRSLEPTEAQRALIMAAPKPGTNRALVTHHFVIERHVPGITPGAIGESEAAVVRLNQSGTLELAGRILLRDWETLGGVTPTPAVNAGHVVPAVAAPASGASSVALPFTTAGRITMAYLQAFNSGDTAQMRTFLEAAMVPNPARAMGERLASYQTLFADLGPLTITQAGAGTDEQLEARASSRKGEVVITVKASASQGGRGTSITFGMTQGGHRK